MIIHERPTMKEAAVIIESAIHATGCSAPVEIIDHNTAVRIGSFNEHLIVRYNNEARHWEVTAYTPYMQRIRTYENLEQCAHEIAMCDERGFLFHRVDETEHEIDAAIEETEAALHA